MLELRERAGVVAGFLGEDVVAETLDVAVSVVAGWVERHGGVRPQRVDIDADERPAFVDVGRQLATALGGGAAQHAGAWLVEISKPCGTTIRLQGPLDAAQLEAVVRGASVAV